MSQEVDEVPLSRSEYHVRIEFVVKHTKGGRFWLKNDKYPIQNNPFKYYLRFTNIGNSPFPGCTVKECYIKSAADDLNSCINNEVVVRSLNCGESIEVYMDSTCLPFKGTTHAVAELTPVNDGDLIYTYQYDKPHLKDDICSKPNRWINAVFFQGELEILQQRTNSLILLLTMLTAYEALIGLRKTIDFIVGGLAWFFIAIGQFLMSLQ